MASISMAQSSSGAYDSNTSTFQAGIGLGTPFFGSGYSSSIPINPTVAYERAVTDAFSAGGELSYAGSKFYGINVNAFYIGARGTYHLGKLVDLGKNTDLYGGVGLGYVIVNVSDNTGDSATASSALGYGLYVGGKYYFSPSVGLYAELGYQSLSYINVGVAFKF